MKTKHIIVIVSTILFTTGLAFCADSQLSDTHPVIGIALDSTPLPALLIKHLGLQPGQGIRIANVLKGSAAEEAGLDRDDIIIGFQGKDLYDGDTIVNAIQQAKAGDEVSLQIIHLGQRKTVTLKLKTMSDTSDWKYPNEPQVEQFFQPGRIFRLTPGDQNWTQIFNEQLPGDIKSNINSFFNEIYSYHYNADGKQYSVTIEGDPNDSASMITVKIDNDQYKTKIGDLDKIPEKYRDAAKNAIENAKQKHSNRNLSIPNWQDGFGDNFMPKLRMNSPLLNVPDSSPNSLYKQLEDQMKQMQKQFDEMEKNQQKLLNRFNDQQDKDSI
jgi:membrane-associated protease RseP (regulator of RpoE activity)